MSRTLVALITFMLVAPVVAFIAAGAAAGINPSIYTGALGFLAGVLFLIAFVYEIRRLASTPSEDLRHGWLPRQQVSPSNFLPTAVQDEFARTRVEVLRDAPGRIVPEAPVQRLPSAKAA